MEYAFYLAGEKWSDHPASTHPLLGELARQVNDFSSDEARQALAELVPDLIGVTGTDPRIDMRIALRAARTALPVVAEERQQIMAVAVLTCERLLADSDGCANAPLCQESRDALALAPPAATWASRYVRSFYISPRAFRRQTAPTIVRYAVQGIARACISEPVAQRDSAGPETQDVPTEAQADGTSGGRHDLQPLCATGSSNPDSLLHELLVGAIEDCNTLRTPQPRRRSTRALPSETRPTELQLFPFGVTSNVTRTAVEGW
jgi:hypothetical protein